MAKSRTLLEEVRALLPKKGQVPWHQRVDPALREELETIKADFLAGKMGSGVTKTGLSTALAKSLLERGIQIGTSGVQQWLQNPH